MIKIEKIRLDGWIAGLETGELQNMHVNIDSLTLAGNTGESVLDESGNEVSMLRRWHHGAQI